MTNTKNKRVKKNKTRKLSTYEVQKFCKASANTFSQFEDDYEKTEVFLKKGEITKNQHFFAYLLKTQLSEIEFNKLIESATSRSIVWYGSVITPRHGSGTSAGLLAGGGAAYRYRHGRRASALNVGSIRK